MNTIYTLTGYDSWQYMKKAYISKNKKQLENIMLTLTDAEICEHNYIDENEYNEIIIWFLNTNDYKKLEFLQ